MWVEMRGVFRSAAHPCSTTAPVATVTESRCPINGEVAVAAAAPDCCANTKVAAAPRRATTRTARGSPLRGLSADFNADRTSRRFIVMTLLYDHGPPDEIGRASRRERV